MSRIRGLRHHPPIPEDNSAWKPEVPFYVRVCKALHGRQMCFSKLHLTAKQDSDLPAGNNDRENEKRGKEVKKQIEMKVRKTEVTPPRLRSILHQHSHIPQ